MSDNLDIPPNSSRPSWPVADAKARLSEVLRRARREGPQRIGERSPCFVVSEEDWKRLTEPQPHLGSWLIERMSGIGEIQLPSRVDPPRSIPFEEA